jgi:2-keto-3-deoxy-L-fuconate dehydrogenase
VEAFIAEGARVIAVDMNRERLADFREQSSIEHCTLDVIDSEAINVAARRYVNVDILVNCAGMVATGSILTATLADLEQS